MTERPTHGTVAGQAYLDLRSLARAAGRATDEYLRLYALEGFLARLAASPRCHDFVLKGGALLTAYEVRRPTADVDLAAIALGNGVEILKEMVVAITAMRPPTPDGLIFDNSHATADVIREEDEYSGVRVGLIAQLATARLAFHVDINVGDPIWPGPQTVTLPRLLGGEIELLGYPIPMILAEKLVTASERGVANTRWRDFADVYVLTRSHDVTSREVHEAIGVVAQHRHVEVRSLREQLVGYAEAGQARWLAWRERQKLADRLPNSFADVVEHVLIFADGCLDVPTAAAWSSNKLAWTRSEEERSSSAETPPRTHRRLGPPPRSTNSRSMTR